MLQTMRMGEWFQLIVPPEWDGITLEGLFREKWEAPKKLIHTYRMEKTVRLNGKEVNWNEPLAAEAKLQIRLFGDEGIQLPPSFQDINILFEDDHVIVVNKPPFMNTHPNNLAEDQSTLINALAFYLLSNGEACNIRQIHRLDRDTSGVILFAKHALGGAILDRMLERREIKRTYLAIVHGLLRSKKGVINQPIGRDRHHSTRRRVSPAGQAAITHYQVIKKDKQKNLSYVKCWLETGRTHQIRVHFSHLGHPLIGDELYGGEPLVNRQALHAVTLEFVHPFTHEKIVCHAPFLDEPAIFHEI